MLIAPSPPPRHIFSLLSRPFCLCTELCTAKIKASTTTEDAEKTGQPFSMDDPEVKKKKLNMYKQKM